MEKIKALLTRNVIIAAVFLAVILCCLALILQIGVFPYFNAHADQKAIVEVTSADMNAATASNNESVTPTPPVNVLPGVVSRGNIVIVNGTGQNGLRMRSTPGTDAPILFVANENEYFNVVDGPVIKDSMIWWKIQSLSDSQKVGWSAQDYLASILP
jgi:hypothetical protein